ncbi:MAG: class I SAM-dependent DNA methyltransferase [Thiomonas arsenitoxydans]|uniref:site-specific DNA-methyltransferase (adenine-specific) n=2 Tax=Thiomonas TaxID=32012 RepID=A0A8I1SWP6_THIA3|nr:DNA methyltransferase [Thiomonas arsenitoxydans]MBN8745642.1 class I SAM-dependent DNA methyltransferase [Thiomonas arsenitoxydans]
MPSPSALDIRRRLSAFAKEWADAHSEAADAKLFWARFYECFGIRPESATIYEKAVDKLGGARGFIDSFIPGKLIVEHKSRGKDLDKAFDQAADYFIALPEAERPRYIITSDFARIRLYDLRAGKHWETTLKALPGKANWFSFLLEDEAPQIVEESPINRNAAYAISKLHEGLLDIGFKGRDLEIFLTRLLFCLFADDTGIFGDNGLFRRLVERTRADGKDLGPTLAALFDVLDTAEDQRQTTLDDDLRAFAYVNGSLFAERTRIPAFNAELRAVLMRCIDLDWSGISPAIFGAMFQGVLEAHAPDERRQASRRELGAHYTSERNILRVLGPLCMDDLRDEFAAARHSKPRLQALYDKLPTLTFFDPACGCGNFLVIAYRELRRLENEVIELLFSKGGQTRGLLDVSTLSRLRVSQFHGIEIDESAAHIARVALWITDHQMNLEAAERFGTTRPTVPLVDSPHIHHANALRTDWAEVLPPEQCSYVLGNPPFVGKSNQNAEQKADMARVFAKVKGAGVLDFVAAWYVKAAAYIQRNPAIDVAFVSTNSITQGEQVAALWPTLLQAGVKIRFAHRTFQWSNEGKGIAAVHCVIIGFGLREPQHCTLFDYGDDIKGDGQRIAAKRINPYLVDAPDVVMTSRRTPIQNVPEMTFGSKPTDGGHLLMTTGERDALIALEPSAAPFVRSIIGAEEFLNGVNRFCLWMLGISPAKLRAMPEVYRRVQAVREMRLKSSKVPTQESAATPYLFQEIRQPTADYLAVPKTSSERRAFVPIDFVSAATIANSEIFTIPGATLYHFAILNSTLHNAWLRAVGGRLKSDYRYSASIVYNNFPWPEPTAAQREAIEAAGQAILDARARYPDATLADLYDPLTMPAELRRAHQANDRAVDAAYGYKGDRVDAPRVAFLFNLYQRLTSLLPPSKKTPRAS